MKKPLRLIAALLAFCVAAAMVPPAGLALEENDLRSGGATLREMIDAAPWGGTVTLTGDVSVDDTSDTAPWIIDKEITINGQNHSIRVLSTGILLGADVTFRNVEIDLVSTDSRNAIIANGYTLTLDNVTANNLAANIFCGTLLPASYENFAVPTPGGTSTLNILGNTDLQGPTTASLGKANIFAGSLAMGGLNENENGPDDNGTPNTFPGDVVINIADSANSSALGTIYAGGGQQRIPVGAMSTKMTVPDPDQYRVGGTVTITGAAIPNVDGAGSAATDIVYQGSGNQAEKTLQNISSLTLESGYLVLTGDSYFRNDGMLSLAGGAKLDLTQFPDPIQTFDGDGGILILKQDQTLRISGRAAGTAKVAIGGTNSANTESTTPAKVGHPYIQAPDSTDADFQLLPYGTQTNMALVRDGSGSWTTANGSSGGDENRVRDFSFDTPEAAAAPGEEAEFSLTVAGSTGNILFLDFIPLEITVNGRAANRTEQLIDGDTYYKYRDQYGYLPSLVISGNILYVSSDADYGTEESPYTIEVTVPANYTENNRNITQSATLKVESSGTPDPGIRTIPVPTANTGLRWTGSEQTGVNGGTGYTLSGDYTATGVGHYEAIAAPQDGYRWTDGSRAPKPIVWSIAKAAGPAAPGGLAGTAPGTEGGMDGGITGTTSAMEYASSADFSDAKECGEGRTTGLRTGTYYIRVKATATHEAGAYTQITVPAPGTAAVTVTGISVSSTAHRTEYNVGESLDVAGLTILVRYSDGSTRTAAVTPDMISGFDSSTVAESQILTVAYAGQTTAYAVRITAGQQPGGHTHSWGAVWNSSRTHHWHDCTASGCPIIQNSLKDGYAAHTAGSWVVDRPASSAQSGIRHRSCTVCGYEMVRESIPATGGSSSGGSSSGGSSSGAATTVNHPDGSTTAVSTNKATGTVTETTRRPDGSKTVVETQRDGTVTTTETEKDGSTVRTVAQPNGAVETTIKRADGLTASILETRNSAEADVLLPSTLVEEDLRDGVVLPIPALPGENASVTVHTGSVRPVPVEIPVYGNDDTTVACFVNGDGSETMLKTAVLSGGQITVSLPDGATVRIRDNSKNFQDTRDHWARDSIDFVAARELFAGKTASTFAPDASMSRAMLMTVLARLDSAGTAGDAPHESGMAWAVARGISDGRNPDGRVTREQFAVMLHRYAGSPAATDRELRFSDAEEISAYAREAVRWAMENGILSGYENGLLVPGGKTTRAQAAAMLARYVKYLNQ